MKNKPVIIGIAVVVVIAALFYWNSTKNEVATENAQQSGVQNQTEQAPQDTQSGEEQSSTQSPQSGTDQTSTPVKTEPASTPTKTTQPVKQAAPQTSSIVLAENKSGSYATVATARLAKPGYVVIYRTNSKEETIVIGRTDLLKAGYYTNLSIQLDYPMARQQVITAVLHEDDGDERYEFPVSDSYMTSGTTKLIYDEDVIDTPLLEEKGMINGTVEQHLKDAKDALSAG